MAEIPKNQVVAPVEVMEKPDEPTKIPEIVKPGEAPDATAVRLAEEEKAKGAQLLAKFEAQLAALNVVS